MLDLSFSILIFLRNARQKIFKFVFKMLEMIQNMQGQLKKPLVKSKNCFKTKSQVKNKNKK